MDSQSKVHETLKKCCKKHGSIPIIKKIKDFTLNGRFVIQKRLNQGAFGKIYSGYDVQTMVNGVYKPVVIKFSKNHAMNDQEFTAALEISQRAKAVGVDFVETFEKGKVLVLDRELRNMKHFSHLNEEEMMKAFDDQVWSYMIQE